MSSYQKIGSRSEFIEYCLRRLGAPVIEINVDDEQIEDRVNDALQLFTQYDGDGSYRAFSVKTITQAMLDRGYIDFNVDAFPEAINRNNIISVLRVFPIDDHASSSNFFDIKYQMRLNDMWDLNTGIGDLAYFEQMQQYLSTIDMRLTGHPQIQYVQAGNTLNIFGDLAGSHGDLQVGDKILIEMYIAVDPNENGRVYDNIFLKEYATALIKEQWGMNLIKFDGMTLPGGVQLNGRQIYEDAKQEIEVTRQRIYNEYDTPPDFFVG